LGGAYLDDPRRQIALPGVLNLRDVGGYPVDGGGSVRWRTLFRSDALHRLDASGVATLTGLGIKTVVDLRTQAEADIAPSPVRGRVIHCRCCRTCKRCPCRRRRSRRAAGWT